MTEVFFVATIILLIFILVKWHIAEKAAKYWLNQYNDHVWKQEGVIKQSVQRSLNTQRSVIKGKIGEEMFPLIMNMFYGYQLADFKFMGGDPIDFIIFKGMSENDIQEIVFVDVKTGNAKLTERQERIKFLVNNYPSKWVTFRMNDDGYVTQE